MKLHWNRYYTRWFAVVIIAIGFISAYVGQSVLPLLITLVATLFLAATLTNKLQPPQKTFVSRLGFAILTSAISVAALNYVVNPFALYPPHVFEPLVLTTRDYKMNLYSTYSPPPQALVIGSSRSFTVDPNQIENLWHYRTFNASLTGGTMQDALAFMRYVSQVGKFPDLLILNVAPEILRWGDDYRYVQEPDARLWNYVDQTDPLYPLRDPFYRITRLFSKEQFEASLRVLTVRSSDPKKLDSNLGFHLDTNGMAHFGATHLSADDLNPDILFEEAWGQMFARYNPKTYRLDVLQQILEMAKEQHTLVIGYLPPYHPVLRDMLEQRTIFTKDIQYLTGQFDDFEKIYPFYYVNFINSPSFSNGSEMFYDVIHPSEQASALMMQQLYDQFHRDAKSS